MICIPKLALEIRDISLLALLLSPRLDDIPQDVMLYVFGRWCLAVKKMGNLSSKLTKSHVEVHLFGMNGTCFRGGGVTSYVEMYQSYPGTVF